MRIAFTKEQAEEICEDFEDLVDTEVVIRTDLTAVRCLIDHVTLAPHDEAELERFINTYSKNKKLSEALAQCKDGAYDVVILACNIDDEDEVIAQPIREYITANGVTYNLPS